MRKIGEQVAEARKLITKAFYLQLLPTGVWRFLFKLVAIMVTWFFHKSVFMAILVYFFPLPYLAYILLSRGFANGTFMKMITYYFI